MSNVSTAPIVLDLDRPRRVTLPGGFGVNMVVKVISGQPNLGIMGGRLLGLEKKFIVASGGNLMPVSDQDQIHVRVEPNRVASFRVSVSGQQVCLVP